MVTLVQIVVAVVIIAFLLWLFSDDIGITTPQGFNPADVVVESFSKDFGTGGGQYIYKVTLNTTDSGGTLDNDAGIKSITVYILPITNFGNVRTNTDEYSAGQASANTVSVSGQTAFVKIDDGATPATEVDLIFDNSDFNFREGTIEIVLDVPIEKLWGKVTYEITVTEIVRVPHPPGHAPPQAPEIGENIEGD
jgi:hypothetical protein